MREMTCEWCGEPFDGRSNRAKYCCSECRASGAADKANQRKERERLREMGQLRREPQVSIEGVIAWIEDHRAKTGEMLSYGHALLKMKAEGYKV